MIKETIKSEVEKLKESGAIKSDSTIFLNFNEYVRTLGLDVTFSIFQTAELSKIGKTINDQHYKMSVISIYLNTTDNLIKNGIKQSDSNWSGNYNYTEEILSKWNELVKYYEYPDSYKSPHIYLFIYSFEEFITNLIVRLSKNEVIELAKMLRSSHPEYVFCSTEPAYNIVFQNKNDYELFNLKYKKMFVSNIYEILKENDPFGYMIKSKVKVNFFHKDMDNFNLYGLSRED